ncbi:MAG: ribosome silencing factor [Candidatus Omnitrophica bacterium]|nr:ribosome silencing factor [Candidatus Omnitrophota bacterium]
MAIFAKVACDEKKGVDPLILDIRKLTDIAEYFVLVHGTSDRHVRTIADHILEHLHAKKVRPLHVEGRNESLWVLLDYGSVMVHVFHHEKRKFYSLERLWGDASIVKAAAKNERPVKSTRRFRTA